MCELWFMEFIGLVQVDLFLMFFLPKTTPDNVLKSSAKPLEFIRVKSAMHYRKIAVF